MDQPLLDIQDLKVSFAAKPTDVVAVDGIQFSIAPGERLGLVGESGSGKSVTALSLMRLIDFEPGEKQISGSIIFSPKGEEAKDLTKLKPEAMLRLRGKRIAMIFQEPMQALNPVLRCGEQIEEAVRLHQNLKGKTARKEVLDLLSKVKILDPERTYESFPFQLSGGQKQRVLIAIALAGKPDLLIADEPTTALDVHVQLGILDLLESLRKEYGMSLLFISHDLGVVSHICDRIIVMKDGKIVEEGLTKTIFDNPQHSYTRGLIACRPKLNQRPNRLPEIRDFNPDAAGRIPVLQEVLNQIGFAPSYQKPTSTPILAAKNLSIHFEGPKRGLFSRRSQVIRAVDDVSFEVYPGETVGLVGASGCGKTTIGRSIVGLVPVTTGELRFRGSEISKLPPKEWQSIRRELQMVFQDPYASLNPRKTIGEAIREPLEVHQIIKGRKAQKDRVIELLEWVGLDATVYNRHPFAFSGGQRQRICIARALALEPDFLIFDESVSALDVSIQAQVLNLHKDLQKRLGFSSIFISHDLAVVNFLADRVIVMDQGKIVESGSSDQIYKNPQSEITQRLIEASFD